MTTPKGSVSDQDLLFESLDINTGSNIPLSKPETDEDLLFLSLDPSEEISPEPEQLEGLPYEDQPQPQPQPRKDEAPSGVRISPLEQGMVYDLEKGFVEKGKATPNEEIKSIQILMNAQFQDKQRADNPLHEGPLDTPVEVNGEYDKEFLKSIWKLNEQVHGMSPEEARFYPTQSGNLWGADEQSGKEFFEKLENKERIGVTKGAGQHWRMHPADLEQSIQEIQNSIIQSEIARQDIDKLDEETLKKNLGDALNVYRVAGAGNWTHVFLDAETRFEEGVANDLDRVIRAVGPRLFSVGGGPVAADKEYNASIERMQTTAEFRSGQKSVSDVFEKHSEEVDPNVGYTSLDEEKRSVIDIPGTMFSFKDQSPAQVRDTVVEWSKDPKAAAKKYTSGIRDSVKPIRNILLDFPEAKTEADKTRTPDRVRAYNLFMYPATLLGNPELFGSQDMPEGVKDSRNDVAVRSKILDEKASEISETIAKAANLFPDKELADDILLSPAVLHGFYDTDDKFDEDGNLITRGQVTRGDQMSRDDRLLYLISITSVDERKPTFGGGGFPALAEKFGELNNLAVKRDLIQDEHRQAYSGDRGGYFKKTFEDWTRAIEKNQDPMDSDELKDSMLLALSALHDNSHYGQILRYGIALDSLNAKTHGQDAVLMWENKKGYPGPNPAADDSIKDAFVRVYRPLSRMLTTKVGKELGNQREQFVKDLDLAYDYVASERGFGKISSAKLAGELVVDSAKQVISYIDPYYYDDSDSLREDLKEKWQNPYRREVLDLEATTPKSSIGAAQRALGPTKGPILPGPIGFWQYGLAAGIPSLIETLGLVEEGETPKLYSDLVNMAFTESGLDQATLELIEPTVRDENTLKRIELERKRSIAAGRDRRRWDLIADYVLEAPSMDGLYGALGELTIDEMPKEAVVGELTLEHMKMSLASNPTLKKDPSFMNALELLERGSRKGVEKLSLSYFPTGVIDEITNLEALKKAAEFRKESLELTGTGGKDFVTSGIMGVMYDDAEYKGGVRYMQESTPGYLMRIVGSGAQGVTIPFIRRGLDKLGAYDKPILDESGWGLSGYFNEALAITYLGHGFMEAGSDFIYSHDIDDASGTARAIRAFSFGADVLAPWEQWAAAPITQPLKRGYRAYEAGKRAPAGGAPRAWAAGSAPSLYKAYVNATAVRPEDKLPSGVDYIEAVHHAYGISAKKAMDAGINPVNKLSKVNRDVLYDVAEAAGVDRDTLRQAMKSYQDAILDKKKGLGKAIEETYKNPTPEMGSVRQTPEYKAVDREIDKAVSQGKMDEAQASVMRAMFEFQSQVASRFPLTKPEVGKFVNHLPDGKTPQFTEPVRLFRIDVDPDTQTFYSASKKALTQSWPRGAKTVKGRTLLNEIRGRVEKAEIKTMGLDKFLMSKKKFTFDEVYEHMNDQRLRVGAKFGIIRDASGQIQRIPIEELFVENPKGKMMFPSDFYKAVEVRSLDEQAPASLPEGALAAGLELPGSTEVFYSAAERALAQSWPRGANTVKGASLLNKIRGRAKKAEIKTMGLDKFLMSKEKFTFDEVYEYINEQRLRVELLVKNIRYPSDLPDITSLKLRKAELYTRLMEIEKPTAFEKPEYDELAAEYVEVSRELQTAEQEFSGRRVRYTGQEAEQGRFSQKGGANPREFIIRVEAGGLGFVPKQSHFEQTGILFFIQTTDRIDPDGNKYICVETIQSDWHQRVDKLDFKGVNVVEYLRNFENDFDSVVVPELEDTLGLTEERLAEAGINIEDDRRDIDVDDIGTFDDPEVRRAFDRRMIAEFDDADVEKFLRFEAGKQTVLAELTRRQFNEGKLQPGLPAGAGGRVQIPDWLERLQSDGATIADLVEEFGSKGVAEPWALFLDISWNALTDWYRDLFNAKLDGPSAQQATRRPKSWEEDDPIFGESATALENRYRKLLHISGPNTFRFDRTKRNIPWNEAKTSFGPIVGNVLNRIQKNKLISDPAMFEDPKRFLQALHTTHYLPEPPLSSNLWQGTAPRFMLQRAAREGYDGVALVNADDLADVVAGGGDALPRILNGLRIHYNPVSPSGGIGKYPSQFKKFSKPFGVKLESVQLSKWEENIEAPEPTPMPTNTEQVLRRAGPWDFEGERSSIPDSRLEPELYVNIRGMPADVPYDAFIDFIEDDLSKILSDDSSLSGERRIDRELSPNEIEEVLREIEKDVYRILEENGEWSLKMLEEEVSQGVSSFYQTIPEIINIFPPRHKLLDRYGLYTQYYADKADQGARSFSSAVETDLSVAGFLETGFQRHFEYDNVHAPKSKGGGVKPFISKAKNIRSLIQLMKGIPDWDFIDYSTVKQWAFKNDIPLFVGDLSEPYGCVLHELIRRLMMKGGVPSAEGQDIMSAYFKPRLNAADWMVTSLAPSMRERRSVFARDTNIAKVDVFAIDLFSKAIAQRYRNWSTRTIALGEEDPPTNQRTHTFMNRKTIDTLTKEMYEYASADRDSRTGLRHPSPSVPWSLSTIDDSVLDNRGLPFGAIKRFVESTGATIGDKTFPATAIRFNEKMRAHLEQNPVELWMERDGQKLGKFETRRDPKAAPSPSGRGLEISITGMRPDFPELNQHWDDYAATKAELNRRVDAGESPTSAEIVELNQVADQYLEELYDLYQPFLKKCLTEDIPPGLFTIEAEGPGFGVWNGDPGEATVIIKLDFDPESSLARDIILGRLAQFSQVFQQGGFLFRERVGRVSGITAEMIDGSAPFPDKFIYTDAGGVNRAVTIVIDTSKDPVLQANARPLLDHMAKRYMGATYDPEIGTITISHTPEWSGKTPMQHLESVREYLEAAKVRNLSVDIDAFRENVYVSEPVKPTKFIASPPKWSKFEGGSLVSPDPQPTPPYGFKEKIYDYETLILHGLEAEHDAFKSRSTRDRGLVPGDGGTAAPGAALEEAGRYPTRRSERTASKSQRLNELEAAKIRPRHFAGFNPRGKRKFQIRTDTGRIDEEGGDKSVFRQVGKNDYLMNPAKTDADRRFRELEASAGWGQMRISDIGTMGRRLGLSISDWNVAATKLSHSKKRPLPVSLREFDSKAAKKLTDAGEKIDIKPLNKSQRKEFAKYYAYQALKTKAHAGVPGTMTDPSTLTLAEMKALNKKIVKSTTPSNAAQSLKRLDELHEEHPNPYSNQESWQNFQAALNGPQEAYLKRLAGVVKYTDPDNIVDLLSYNEKAGTGLTPRMLEDTNAGFANIQEFRQAYESGEMGVVDTGMLFLWGMLSRRMSPYPHESLFMDAVLEDVGPFIEAAAEGRFDADMLGPTKMAGPRKKDEKGKFKETVKEFEDRRAAVLATGNTYAAYMQRVFDEVTTIGSPGVQSRSNLHDFGKDFLLKMNAPVKSGRFAGQYPLQVIHDAMADFTLSGPEVRRRFVEVKNGKVGVDLKVVSFIILVAGRDDVLVLDRIQARNLADNEALLTEYKNDNVYDGFSGQKAGNKQPYEWQAWSTSSGMAAIMSDVRGLALYEATERAIEPAIIKAYAELAGQRGADPIVQMVSPRPGEWTRSVLDDYTVEFTERPSNRYLDDGTPDERGSEFALHMKEGDEVKGWAIFRKEGMLSEALTLEGPGVNPNAEEALRTLLERHGDAPVVRGWQTEIDYNLRRQGIGTALYENMMQRLRLEYPQGVYFVPSDYLPGGSRKVGAFALWDKLTQRHPSEGEAIYIAPEAPAAAPPVRADIDTKVVDDAGKPLVMYHGSPFSGIDFFETYGTSYGLYGTGAYFTDNRSVASAYATSKRGVRKAKRAEVEPDPSVTSVYLNIKNPIDMDAVADPEKWLGALNQGGGAGGMDGGEIAALMDVPPAGANNKDWLKAIEDVLRSEEVYSYDGAEFIRQTFENMGYDGLTHIERKGMGITSEVTSHRVYVAFEPAQIDFADDFMARGGAFDAPVVTPETPAAALPTVYGSLGRFHWESWVVKSQQEVGHGSLGVILNIARGVEDPTAGAVTRQGKLISYMYGVEYVSLGGGERAFIVRDANNKPFIMNKEQLDEYIRYAKKAVPSGYEVTAEATAWYKYVDTTERDAEISRIGRPATAEEIRLISDSAHGGRRPVEGSTQIADQPDAPTGIHGGISSDGVRELVDQITGAVVTLKDLEELAQARQATPKEVSRAIYNQLGVDILTDADGSVHDVTEFLKIYTLEQLIENKSYSEVVELLDQMSNDPESALYDWKYKEFGPRFEADGTPIMGEEGQLYQRPDHRSFNYQNKHAWLYSPHTSAGSFKDPQYTLFWRATHEIAHGIVNPELTEIYDGQGRRAGALGFKSVEQYAVDEYGRPVEFTHEPLSFASALRSIDWEHKTFFKQREILEEMGITITDKQFAQEYMINMVDATHRVLTGQFSSPGELGIDLKNPPTPEKMFNRARVVIATHAQDRGMDMNMSLTEANRRNWDPKSRFMKRKGEVMGMFESAHASRFNPDGKTTAINSAQYILTFFRDADFSVWLHEKGHLLTEIMGKEWTEGFFRSGFELNSDGLPTDKGHEQAADAYRYYFETRMAANGRLKYYFDTLWSTGIRDLYYRWRYGPAVENLPKEMRDFWDENLRPDQKALPRAIELNAERVKDRIPVIRVSDDPVKSKIKGEVERPQKAKEALKVNTKREDVLQALGLKPGDSIPVNEFTSRAMAYMLTEQTRKAFGAGELVAMTMRTVVPASRVKRIAKDVADMFAAHCGMPPQAFIEKTADPRTGELKLDSKQKIGLRAYAEQVAVEPMGHSVPGRLINPSSDLTFVSFEEINQLRNAAVDIHAGVGARRDAKAESVPPNVSKMITHTLANIPDYLAEKWGNESLLATLDWLKGVFKVEDEFGDYIDPGIKNEIKAMMRDIGDTQNWFRRTANEVRKAGPHKNKVILKTLDEMRRMLNPPIPVAAGNHRILVDVRNKFRSLQHDGRPTALPTRIRSLTDENFLAQIRGVFRDGGGYFISESGSTFNEVAALNILTEYGHRLSLSRRAYGEPVVDPGAGPDMSLNLTDAETIQIQDALDTVLYGLDRRHQLIMDRAIEIAIGMGASKDKNVLLALNETDFLNMYEKFFSGRWGELDAEFPAIETGIETYKIPRVRRPMLYAELVLRMRANEVIAGFAERLAQEGLLFTYENMTEKLPVGSVFRDGYMDNVVYFLNQQATGAKSHLITKEGKFRRQGIKRPPGVDYYGGGTRWEFTANTLEKWPRTMRSQVTKLRKGHTKQAYIDAMEIMRSFGFKSFKGEWERTLLPDGSEAIIPTMLKNAIDEHLEATAEVGRAYGAARGKSGSYRHRMMDIRSHRQGPGMPEAMAERLGMTTRPAGQVARMSISNAISTFFSLIPGSGVAINVGLTVGPLIVTPAYFSANILGGFFQTYQKTGFLGMITAPFSEPQMTSAVVKRLWGDNSAAPGDAVVVTKDGRVYTADMLAAEAMKRGLDSSFIRSETIETIASELNRTHSGAVAKLANSPRGLINIYTEGATASDNYFRVGVFINELKNGKSLDDAAQAAREALFDYSALTDVEKSVFRRCMLFYSFFRKNLDLFIDTLLTNPHRIAGQVRMMNLLQEELLGDESEILLPEYYKARVVAHFRDAFVNRATDAGVATIMPMTPLADIIYLTADLADLFANMVASIGGSQLPGTEHTLDKPVAGLLSKLHPYIQAAFVIGLDKDLFWGQELDSSYNVVPNWFVELDQNMTGGALYDVLEITPVYLSEDKEYLRPFEGATYQFRAGRGDLWYLLRQAHMVPGLGRSMDTVTQLDRANLQLVEGTVRASRVASEYWQEELNLQLPYPAITGEGNQLDESLAQTYSEATGDTMTPREGLTEAEEFWQLLGLKQAFVPTSRAAYDKMAREAVYTAREAERKAKKTPDTAKKPR